VNDVDNGPLQKLTMKTDIFLESHEHFSALLLRIFVVFRNGIFFEETINMKQIADFHCGGAMQRQLGAIATWSVLNGLSYRYGHGLFSNVLCMNERDLL